MGTNISNIDNIKIDNLGFNQICPMLCSKTANPYQAFRWNHNQTGQLYIIKQSTIQPLYINYGHQNQNIMQKIFTRFINGMYYTVYQSKQKNIQQIGFLIEPLHALYLMQKLVCIYQCFWRVTGGAGIDIRSQNIFVAKPKVSPGFFQFIPKVYPPQLTTSQNPYHLYLSSVKDLGNVLLDWLQKYQQKIGENIIKFIKNQFIGNPDVGLQTWTHTKYKCHKFIMCYLKLVRKVQEQTASNKNIQSDIEEDQMIDESQEHISSSLQFLRKASQSPFPSSISISSQMRDYSQQMGLN